MRNVRRADKFENLVRLLSEQPHPITKKSVFPTMRELLCFAAVLGYHEGQRTPIEGKTNEIDGRVFPNSQQAIDLIYLIALIDAKDPMILHDDREDEMIRIFEEYANTGLGVLDRWMKEKPDDNIGDQAILSAFQRHGLLNTSNIKVENVLVDVEF